MSETGSDPESGSESAAYNDNQSKSLSSSSNQPRSEHSSLSHTLSESMESVTATLTLEGFACSILAK